jgi:hypothetical protein
MTADKGTGSTPPVANPVTKALAPHRDPNVPAAERHVMWLDRQEVYLAWTSLMAAFVIALAFLGTSAWLIHSGNALSGTVLGTR